MLRFLKILGWVWIAFWALIVIVYLVAGNGFGGKFGGLLISVGFAAMLGIPLLRGFARRPSTDRAGFPGWVTKHPTLTASLAVTVIGFVFIGVAGSPDVTTVSADKHVHAAKASATPSEVTTSTPSLDATPSELPTPSPVTTPVDPADATASLTQLATLVIQPDGAATKYQRTRDFGEAWDDSFGDFPSWSHNGCSTRDDVLRRDLVQITSSGCKVMTGVLHDPYTGTTVDFLRGNTTSTLVQIDHVVPLGNAWATGASTWQQTQREALANDPDNLLAVDQHSNESKGDKDASTWLPPLASFDCTYVSKQITVKAKYGLWITQAEHDAMARVLTSCGAVLPTTAAPAPVVQAPAPKTQAPAPKPAAPKVQAPAPAPPAPAAPAPAPAGGSAPRAGEFCSNADHGLTVGGLTCTLYPSGTWHWKH